MNEYSAFKVESKSVPFCYLRITIIPCHSLPGKESHFINLIGEHELAEEFLNFRNGKFLLGTNDAYHDLTVPKSRKKRTAFAVLKHITFLNQNPDVFGKTKNVIVKGYFPACAH